ncbi:MAG: restriction endonuclease [Labrys sp. (in: a-proteobacteria)]|jgi:restriction system protein
MKTAVGFFLAVLVLAGVAAILPETRPVLILVIGAVAVIAIVILSGRGRSTRQAAMAHAAAVTRVEAIARDHLETLARRRIILARRDHYGVIDEAAWAKEMRHFADKVARPALGEPHVAALSRSGDVTLAIRAIIEPAILTRASIIEADLAFSDGMSSEQFEDWCAKRLTKLGWKTSLTAASGDQGADVLAEKGAWRIILQCKLYTNPVGNKAVQEAYAAQRHYRARASAVVTNADFTRSARTLAATTGVLLLHHGDLDRLDALLEAAPGRTRPIRASRTPSATDG